MKWQTKETQVPFSRPLQTPVQPTAVERDSSYAAILQRMETASRIPLEQAKWLFVFACGFFLLIGLIISVETEDWNLIWNLLAPILVAWAIAMGYFSFSLHRWHKMITSIRTGDFDGDGKPDKNKVTTLAFKIDRGGGNVSVVHTDILEEDKQHILTMARAFVANRPTSQQEMAKLRIGRRKWQKIVRAFEDLKIIEKNGDKNNDTYVLKTDDVSRGVMQDLSYGRYEVLKDVWG